MKLLDLYCCGGGAAVGYHRAGFEVVGVDIEPQPHYPFEFVQSDVLSLSDEFLAQFDAIHASPPCQKFSTITHIKGDRASHDDLVDPTRQMLRRSGKPYIIENVMGAPLIDPIMLCGTMFGLRVYRHRIFESNVFMMVPAHTKHRASTGSHRGYSKGDGMITPTGHNFSGTEGAAAMGIDWTTNRYLIAQAIPPAFTEFLGRQLIKACPVLVS